MGVTVFLVRSSIASMDSAVRGAFLSAIIPKESRTRFMGSESLVSTRCFEEYTLTRTTSLVINVCKTMASAPGPTLSGALASWGNLRWAFVICGSVKVFCTYSLFR